MLYATLSPTLGFLHRLGERMDKRQFPPNDKLVLLTRRAYEALHALCVELHYLSCGSGVGRPSQP